MATAIAHLSVAERAARGKAARAEVPRSSHAHFEPSAERADPIELLQGLRAGGDGDHVVAVPPRREGQQRADRLLVVDDQDAGGSVHQQW